MSDPNAIQEEVNYMFKAILKKMESDFIALLEHPNSSVSLHPRSQGITSKRAQWPPCVPFTNQLRSNSHL